MSLKKLGQALANFFGEENPLDLLSNKEEGSDAFDVSALSEIIPYRLYDERTKIFENANSFGFFFEVMPCLGASPEMQQEMSGLIKEIGEEGTSVQMLQWADGRIEPFLREWSGPRESAAGVFQKIAEKKRAFFEEKSFSGDPSPRVFRCFFSYSVPKSHAKNNVGILLEHLAEKKKKAIATFSRFTHVFEPKINDFLEILSGLINQSGKMTIEKRKKWNRHAWLAKQITLPGGGVEVRKDGLIFHEPNEGERPVETCFKTYEAVDVPDSWSMSRSGELIGDFFNGSYRISSPFFLHYSIYFPDQSKKELKFRGKSKVLEHQFKFPALVRMFPNMPREREENLLVNSELLEGEKFVETRLSCGLWSPKERFLKVESTLLSLFQKYGFKLRENHCLHLPDFIRSLPMCGAEDSSYMRTLKMMSAYRTTLSYETAHFLPMLGEWWGNSRKGMILMGRRGQIASWDPFASEGNLNSVVVGPSGSGKSVFMQDLIMSELGQGGRVFVLDLGRSFEKLCHLLKGQYLFFNHKSCLNLNPFSLIKTDGDVENLNVSLEMVASIVATMAMPAQKIDKERADIINSVVKLSWEKKKSRATVDDVIELLDTLSFRSELMVGATESLKEGLRKFTTTGVYSNYFYGSKEVNFSESLVVIETEELKNMPDLQAVVLQIFSLTISNQVFLGDREQRSLVCIDEAWDLLKSPQMEGFIESMARRLRKYNGALLVGTQSLKDFERSAGARAAFQNSNWLLMLGKDNDSTHMLREGNIISMSDYEEQMLMSLKKEDGKYSEVFIHHKGTGFSTLNQLYLDPFSAALYSTKAEDFQMVCELEKMGISVEEAIEWMVENKKELKVLLSNGVRVKDALERVMRQAVPPREKSLAALSEEV